MAEDVSPLFAPFSLGSLTPPNRFVMAPMTRGGSPGGAPGQAKIDYYRRRAEGGVGLIVTEGVGIDHPTSLGFNDYNGTDIPFLFGAEAMAGWREVVDAVHSCGGKIAPQLWHQGVMRSHYSHPFPDHPSSRPSGLWGPDGGKATIAPHAVERLLPPSLPMSNQEIADVIAAFARSAALAQDAGFDAIALHGAHGYLIDSFLWDQTNRRADHYGGDRRGRTRFALDVVRAVRDAIGTGLPIIFRFSQWKQQDFDAGLATTPAELEDVLGPIADAGVDIFDASTRNFQTAAFDGSPLNLAGWAKKLTGKPSMTVGGVGLDKEIYDSFVSGSLAAPLQPLVDRFIAGEFDLVGVGRALIADPQWTNKVRRNEPREAFIPTALADIW